MTPRLPITEGDLLQQRRQELDFPVVPAPIRSPQRLLLIGGGVGSILLGTPLIVQFLLQMQVTALERQLKQLAPIEQQVTALQQRLKATTDRVQALQSETKRITAQLVSVRSGSAFLEQLRRTTPAAVSLRNVAVQPASISLSGAAGVGRAGGSWDQVNAFALNLESLPSIPPEGARVQQATADGDASIRFNMNVKVDPAIQSSPEQLRDLGAEGLARRYLLLKQRGLPL